MQKSVSIILTSSLTQVQAMERIATCFEADIQKVVVVAAKLPDENGPHKGQ